MIYQFKKGSYLSGSAQAVGECFEELQAHCGSLTPDVVVQAAAKRMSPLHKYFTWDDGEAAIAFREQQARHLLACVITILPESTSKEPVRAFVNVVQDGVSTYAPIQVAMSNADLRQQVLQHALQELAGWQTRYSAYTELASIFIALESSMAEARLALAANRKSRRQAVAVAT